MHDFHDRFLAGDVAGAAALLAPDAVLHSPVTDYRGRERIAAVHTALAGLLGDAQVTSVLRGERETAVAFRGSIADRDADGVLRVVGDGEGAVSDVTLLVRPLDVLLAGVARMKEALAARR